jgi:DNA-binding winged helix-turn-helix (wHTH) protein
MIGLRWLMFLIARTHRTNDSERFRLRSGLTINPLKVRVERDGRTIPVEPRVMELLLYFSSNPGRVISKRELMDEVWGTNVVDEAVHRAVSLLRTALGDSAQDPKIIATVPKRGYRMLIAPSTVHEPSGWRLAWLATPAAVAIFAAGILLRAAADRAPTPIGNRAAHVANLKPLALPAPKPRKVVKWDALHIAKSRKRTAIVPTPTPTLDFAPRAPVGAPDAVTPPPAPAPMAPVREH